MRPQIDLKNAEILIVDDNPKNLQVLSNILVQQGYSIEFATDGYQAIDWIENKPFDLILLDVMMPEIDGFEVCQKLKAKKEFNGIPIIFLTAKTDKESIIKGFESGGQDYITKPFDSHELLARVETHLILKFSQEKLKNVNKWLEEQVALKTEELRVAYDELTLLDEAKIEFLKILSHELRTPLNGIKGFAQILKQKLNPDLLHYIDIIDLSADRLERFSRVALLISSLRTKSYPLKLEKIGVYSILKDTCNDFTEQLDEKNLEIQCESTFNADIITADSELIKETFDQLIENAIIYSDNGGKINVSISDDDNLVTVLIKDSGKGFSKEALENIFQPFGLGQDHIDKKVGLGLHLVKLIIDAHKATINIGNNKDGGSYVGLILNKNIK